MMQTSRTPGRLPAICKAPAVCSSRTAPVRLCACFHRLLSLAQRWPISSFFLCFCGISVDLPRCCSLPDVRLEPVSLVTAKRLWAVGNWRALSFCHVTNTLTVWGLSNSIVRYYVYLGRQDSSALPCPDHPVPALSHGNACRCSGTPAVRSRALHCASGCHLQRRRLSDSNGALFLLLVQWNARDPGRSFRLRTLH